MIILASEEQRLITVHESYNGKEYYATQKMQVTVGYKIISAARNKFEFEATD